MVPRVLPRCSRRFTSSRASKSGRNQVLAAPLLELVLAEGAAVHQPSSRPSSSMRLRSVLSVGRDGDLTGELGPTPWTRFSGFDADHAFFCAQGSWAQRSRDVAKLQKREESAGRR
jgi:hypothetical protein